MGEALISRASGGGEVESIIPITPGYHTIRCTISDFEGKRVPEGIYINCKDGSRWYNYTTNASGQVMFVCNSGSANIRINNSFSGIRYLDFNNTSYNIDAPVGLTSDIKINLEKGPASCNIESNTTIRFIQNRITDVDMIGGGQGGYNGTGSFWSETRRRGQGGNAGWYNRANNLQFISGIDYRCYIGTGGSINGGAGGTTYISNTNISAAGGGAGGTNAGRGGSSSNNYGGNGINGLGGGGGYFSYAPNTGGSPYGGYGAYWDYQDSTVYHMPAGSAKGPGGGGGGGDSEDQNPQGGAGYRGLIRINIKY